LGLLTSVQGKINSISLQNPYSTIYKITWAHKQVTYIWNVLRQT